jgi:hypothetical protein
MFEEFVNPTGKKKGKDKDVGKRRAYVRVVTSLGGGSLNLELYCEKVRFWLSSRVFTQPMSIYFRRQKRAITSSCSQRLGNTIIACFIV